MSNVQEFGSKIFLMEHVKWTADVYFMSVLEGDNDKLPRMNVAFSTCRGITAFAGRQSLVEGYTKLRFKDVILWMETIGFWKHRHTIGRNFDLGTSINLEDIVLYSLNYGVLQAFLFSQI
ncbi:hypothetical protein IW262DRAFT_1299101 [Armillaria fumosa]|nr:hypothetical protein IW262DRAFT_1299101 [Armillaria fumosa]